MNIALIGCGQTGQKRALAKGSHRLVIAADTNIDRAMYISKANENVIATTDWMEAAGHPEVELVLVATTNDWLTPVSLFALEQGKHVLVEKPAARSPLELAPLLRMSQKSGKKIKVGFNLRFHPALMKAKEIVESTQLGELMFVRGRYGHGGRTGYDKEWRADPVIAGGGALLDLGVHLIDLSRWFLGDFDKVSGHVSACFWDMQVEDNAFISLQTAEHRTAWLQASCSEWKNMFCFEIYGRNGKLQIDGLGGSYGPERLTLYRMLPEMGPPETTIWEYPFPDSSWKSELDYFIEAIEAGIDPEGGLQDAGAALEIVRHIYEEGTS